MASFSYRTLQAPAEGTYKEKGSKFLAFAYPTTTESEIKQKLGGLKKKYFDAKHHCYAFVLGPPENKSRAFDAGEPNHSAGDPILGRIKSKNLTNVLIVVVRYFGGVKLGVGGLAQAYKAAAEKALENAAIIEMEMTEAFRLTYGYAALPNVMRLMNEFDLKMVRQDFTAGGSMNIEVSMRDKEKFLEKIKLLQALKVDLKLT
jgi:uncharacterized YigZ family protein